MKRICFLLLAGLFISLTTTAHAGKLQKAKLKTLIPFEMDYLISLPEDYSEEKPSPLLLFLHGAGERGDNLNKVKTHGPPKLIANGKDFPFIVVSPQCDAGDWWRAKELSVLLDNLEEEYNVDPDRIYITGLSMGGYGTWELTAYSPDRFAAAIPICGGGIPYQTRNMGKLPFWVFHGAKDPVVPLAKSEEMVEGLKRHKGNVKFTVYPEADHDSWTKTYDNPEIYDWLLKHKRSDRIKNEE